MSIRFTEIPTIFKITKGHCSIEITVIIPTIIIRFIIRYKVDQIVITFRLLVYY